MAKGETKSAHKDESVHATSATQKMHSRTRLVVAIALPLVFLALAVVAQKRFDAIVGEHFDIRAPIHRFAMPAGVVKHLAFGFDHMLADYYWVTAIQDFNKWDRHDVFYPEYFRIIATLDPTFAYPYNFAILTVPNKYDRHSLSWLSDIADRGITALPKNWEIPFYTGVQFHVVGKSREEATKYIAIADAIPTRPDMVHTTYAIYLMHDASEYKRSRALFEAIAETTTNDETKKMAEERIALLDIMEKFDQTIAEFKKNKGEYPNDFAELFKDGYLPPSDDLKAFIQKFAITIDQSSGRSVIR
jgi:hypothetical protein